VQLESVNNYLAWPCLEFAGCFRLTARTVGLEDESVAVVAVEWMKKGQKKRRTAAAVAAQDDYIDWSETQ
jgi:hypothetical protein